MYHFTTTTQYVCKERENQLEDDNIDNDNSLHLEGLLLFWHCSKLITYTRLYKMKLPIFGCSWPTEKAISCGPIYVYSSIFEQSQDEDGDPKLPEVHRKIKCHLFLQSPHPLVLPSHPALQSGYPKVP